MSTPIDWSSPAEQGRQTCQEVLARLDAVMSQFGAGVDRTVTALDRAAETQRALTARVAADVGTISEVAGWLRAVGDAIVDGAGRGLRVATTAIRNPTLVVGTAVEVRYLADRWSRGFEIVDLVDVDDHQEFQVRRRSDRTKIPGTFTETQLRAEAPAASF